MPNGPGPFGPCLLRVSVLRIPGVSNSSPLKINGFMGILATPPKATLPRNKALLRAY